MHTIYSLMNSGTVFSLFLQVVPITLLVGAAYAVYRCIRIRKQRRAVCWGKELMRWLFVCYLTGLVNLILVPAGLWMHIWATLCIGYSHSEITLFSGTFNLVPTGVKLLAGQLTPGRWVLKMLLYNFLMFLPFGFFLPFVSGKVNRRSIWKIALLVPVIVEAVQPVIGRSFDADDLLLNFAGIVVGYFAAVLLQSIRRPA